MKKLLIIITLFVSSFFFICNKEVKAAEITISFEDYSLVNSEIFLEIKSQAEQLKESISFDNYLISYIDYESTYYVQFFNKSPLILTNVATDIYGFSFDKMENYKYDPSTSSLVLFASFPNYIFASVSKYFPLYSNVNVYFSYSSNIGTFSYISPDYSKIGSSNYDDGLLPLLYNICVDSGNCGSVNNNPHQEEIDNVTNFYTMIIEKIEYLANEISNNYILLFVIGIFIVTFVFLLIFRRFLW